MYGISSYLTEAEGRAEQEYRRAYYDEYMRLYDPAHSTRPERVVYWSELAHRAGKSARDRSLRQAAAALVANE